MSKIKNFVSENNCCGCGICSVACPHDAIVIELNEQLSYRPVLNEEKCTNCGICLNVCSFSEANLSIRAQKATNSNGYYGFDTTNMYLQGYENNDDLYMKSASGGLLSALANYLLENKKVDAILHAGSCFENGEKPLAICKISRKTHEINQTRGSFYGPIEFSSSILQINNSPDIQKVAIICTPCVASSIKLLREKRPKVANKLTYVFTLMCGHNASGKHGLLMVNDFPELQSPRKLYMREKEGFLKKDSYNISAESNGEKIIKPIESRFKPLWRGFWNAESMCLKCVDFPGNDSDASFKDAWRLQPIKYYKGESAVVVRNPEIKQILEEMTLRQQIVTREISREAMVTSQWSTIKDRYYNALLLSKSKKGNALLKVGYMGCRILKKISIGISQKASPHKFAGIQLILAGIIGKFLAGFARFTNERR